MELEIIRLAEVSPDPEQPRREVGDVGDLVESINQVGFNSVLTVEVVPGTEGGPRRYRVVTGGRRLAAAQAVGIEYLPAIIYEVGEQGPLERLQHQVFENDRRRPLAPTDRGRAVVQLKLMLDCQKLLAALEPGAELANLRGLAAWQAERQRLVGEAERRGLLRQRDGKLVVPRRLKVGWEAVEQMMGISNTECKWLVRLGELPADEQAALRQSSLSEQQQVAVSHAPAGRLVAVLDAVLTYPKPPRSAVILGAARALVELGGDVPVAEVLDAAVAARAQGVRQAAEITAGIIAQFSPVEAGAVGAAATIGDEDRPPVPKLAQVDATAPTSLLDQPPRAQDWLPEVEQARPALTPGLAAAPGDEGDEAGERDEPDAGDDPAAGCDRLIIDGVRAVEQAVVASLAQVAVAGRDAQRRLLAMVAEKLNELERQLAVGL